MKDPVRANGLVGSSAVRRPTRVSLAGTAFSARAHDGELALTPDLPDLLG
jgi:hypothetical protein